MQRIDGHLVLSPTDLTKHVACPHVTTLDLEALGQPRDCVREVPADDALNLVFSKGLEHERAFLARLRDEGRVVEDIALLGLKGADAEAATVDTMRRGVDVVYQATFFDGHWVGLADFLLRVDLPEGESSALGSWRYDIADTKLARRLKVPALLQMATYAARLETLQGVPPQWLTVVTGDSELHPWRLVDVAPYARRRREELVDAVSSPQATESARVAHCGQCRWKQRCADEWEARDDLVLVAGMRPDHRARLRESGIDTLEALAEASEAAVAAALPGTRSATRERLHQQARLQLEERETRQPQFRLVEPPWLVTRDRDGTERRVPRGLATLPAPDLGDVYLDFEGDPWAEGGAGREYLAGIWTRQGEFVDFWAHDFAAEGQLTTDLVDWLTVRWRAHPDMHIYHYAPYETTALKRLVSQHATREHELDQLLRAERFVDLYAVVRQGIRISKGSYSIKKLEQFYWGHTRGAGDAEGVSDGLSSVVEYERWLVGRDTGSADQAILDDIRRYNQEDVESTLALHDWLEARRDELVARGHDISRPVAGEAQEIGEAERAEIALAERLVHEAEVAEEAGETGRAHAAELLAGCVGWHRREDRPEWWDFFSYADLEPDELVESSGALGALAAPVEVGKVKQSIVWRYTFPPQDCALKPGGAALDVDTRLRAGEIVGIDPVAGWVDVKLGKRTPPPAARGLMGDGPLNNQVMRDSIRRTAEAFLSGTSTLGVRLVEGVVPPADVLAGAPGESASDVVVRVGAQLGGSVLAVQGPPGAGKTYAGAHLIRRLLDDGLTVGVTGLSHNVIRKVLDEVGRPALHRRSGDDPELAAPDGASTEAPVDGVTESLVRLASNNEVAAALASGSANLVGGTAWLWSREELAEAVDVLVIDEAGQFSLANAVAVSQAARSLVLLGDPQQLQQPTKAVHPYGAGVSVLEHLIGEHDVIPADRGVFLDRTWRMHPDITGFVSELAYEGQLLSAEPDATQDLSRVDVRAPGALSGTGLRWVPVRHVRPVDQASAEEAAVVRELVDDLLRGEWTSKSGASQALTLDDIVVVAPYNAHVAELRTALPDGTHVGTVDKFQGQEGAVVIYSMGSTSAALAPRGVSFLYDLHRLNVAISRAKAMAVVVGSPLLTDAEVHTPEDLRAV
ncbi:MAG: TM0106 family RecB-like putative nuclease, partial [Dermatophilaceae bacterium]|nr:TM0106 family RecB-like putative nuclease [Dermatophilaceae bacterium]